MKRILAEMPLYCNRAPGENWNLKVFPDVVVVNLKSPIWRHFDDWCTRHNFQIRSRRSSVVTFSIPSESWRPPTQKNRLRGPTS